jgi:hypothetical protein
VDKNMQLKPSAKFWDVRITVPHSFKCRVDGVEKEFPQTKHIHLMVCAVDAESVVRWTMRQHPTASIYQINHRGGDCAIVIDPELIEPSGIDPSQFTYQGSDDV